MSTRRAYTKLSVALALTSVMLITTSVSGQSPATRPNSTDQGIAAAHASILENPEKKVAASESKPGSAEKKVATDEPNPTELKSEIEAVKAENAAVREQLRKLEEQQRTLLEQFERLQRRLNAGTATDLSVAGQPTVSPTTDASAPAANGGLNTPQPVTNSASTSVPPASVGAPQENDERYRDGMVLWQTPEDAKVPFLLKFNINTQLRYLNTLSIPPKLLPTTWAMSAKFIRATTSP